MLLPHANGWIPDLPDHRDYPYRDLRPQHRLLKAALRPSSHYLHEDNLPRLYNQGRISSCVGHGSAEAAAYAFDYVFARADGKRPEDLSRLFAYYIARRNKNSDDGAYIREAMKAIGTYGICRESAWPYDETKWSVRPPDSAFEAAKKMAGGVTYFRIESIGDAIDCIAQDFPVVFGLSIYDSFCTEGGVTANGVMPMPGYDEGSAGGHCMLGTGYSMQKRALYVRNSWGPGWGQRGNVWIPFSYMENHADDLWTIRHFGLAKDRA